jgi:predicted Na+-dependent transporter
MRRALEAGGHSAFAPALHLAIVLCAVITVPATVAILDIVFDKDFTVSPLDIAHQVFFAQLLPVGLGIALRAWRSTLSAQRRNSNPAMSMRFAASAKSTWLTGHSLCTWLV